jgi:hypothetical protein
MHPLDDVEVKVNWFELRIMAQWAEQWAARHVHQYPHMQKVIYAITQALEEQCPSFQPLTLAGEYGVMQMQHPEAGVPAGNIKPIMPKTRLQ